MNLLMRKYIFLISFIVLGRFQLLAQNIGYNPIEIVTQKKGVSLRGLSIPNEQTIWASGSAGNIAKSEDGGNTFVWSQVVGYEKRDFRSIHAWNKKEAIIVAVSAPAVILKTKDGGASWVKVYENADTSMFLDAIDFVNTKNGYVIGDPINGHFYLLQTKNKGDTWKLMPYNYFKESPKEGEAFFASSATNLTHFKKHQYLVSGGKVSRLWMDGLPIDIPILQGGTSTGANSIAVSSDGNDLLIVGGDFSKDKSFNKNLVHLQKMNSTWSVKPSSRDPKGYRSCVQYLDTYNAIACGTSGVDVSFDKGNNWLLISNESFHVLKKQPNTTKIFLAGSGGRIGVIPDFLNFRLD
jgi:photosystem II stability/assembly factor-like uncharacterized protein